ncbi:hypothetical protein JXO59_00110 [candidate division KSB1 bacterium]|nr:hypothetical protein [candidate division KSB1 bacterium]
MKSKQQHSANVSSHIWPEDEKPCIWMQAGLVEYKLCDRQFDCENCPFDALMSGSNKYPVSKERHLKKINVSQKSRIKKSSDHEDIWATYRQIFFDPQAYYGIDFWYIKTIEKKVARIGLNDLAVLFLPNIREVILPRCNTHIASRQTCAWLVTSEGTIPLCIPIAGKVVRVNDQLLKALNNPDTADRGSLWLFEYESEEIPPLLPTMLKGNETAVYLMKQWESIVGNMERALYRHNHLLGVTSQDGGQRLQSVEQMLGEKEYFEIISGYFQSHKTGNKK